MNKKVFSGLVLIFAVMSSMVFADAGQITGVAVYAVSGWWNTYTPQSCIDGTGQDIGGVADTAAADGGYWYDGFNNNWITVDLGGAATLNQLKIWNLNHPSAAAYDWRFAEVLVSLTNPTFDNPAEYQDLGQIEIPVAPGNNTTPFGTVFPITHTGNIRYVKLVLKQKWAADGLANAGLSEIKFYGTINQQAGLGPCVDVNFVADADGTTQKYVRRLPSDFNALVPHNLLITLHGHGSDRWQFASSTAWNECIAVRDFAAARNMILVSPDYRATTSWMGPLAEKDVVQIIEYHKRNYLINKVYICGGSMGGTSALTFTVLHPTMVDGVIAINPLANHLEFENFQDAISASFGGSKQQVPNEYKKRSAEYWPEKFNVPVGISTGGQDTIVPPDSAIRLAGVLAKTGKKVKHIHRESMGHSTSYADTMEILNFVADTNIHNDTATRQLYSIPGAGLVFKYPGIPSPPSSGDASLEYKIGTVLYDRGASICSNGAFRVMLTKPATTFKADIGLYSGVCYNGDVKIKIVESANTQHILWQSSVMLTGQQAVHTEVNIADINAFDIIVEPYDGDTFCDSVIFANAQVVFQDGGNTYLDEAQGSTWCILNADYDGNCKVDLKDFKIFAEDWLKCGYEFQFLCNN